MHRRDNPPNRLRNPIRRNQLHPNRRETTPATNGILNPLESYDEELQFEGSFFQILLSVDGKIRQLWSTDPMLPDEGEQFQFILPPVAFGEESSDEYLPGTILIGARMGPNEPWVLSKNQASVQPSDEEGDLEANYYERTFHYNIPLLPEIVVSGKFYESEGPIPRLIWEVTIANSSRRSIEIGEVGFPLAFNSIYDGFGWTDDQLRQLWNSRLYIHKFIGGSASWVYAQRMNATNPGLLVFPGDDTSWEFYNHVPASLTADLQWEGIPVVYAHSKATIEREEWTPWEIDHTSFILEPQDKKVFQMCFMVADGDNADSALRLLPMAGKQAVRVLPSAVAPIDVGIAIEVAGATPKSFQLSRDAYTEVDLDSENSFCFVKPKKPGPMRVTFEDDKDQLCHVQLFFTEPLERLIQKRADYICRHQLVNDPKSRLYGAFVLTDTEHHARIETEAFYSASNGIECSLADALYLAEKNTIYPERRQIQLLDRYIQEFLLDDVQNPSDHAVGTILTPEAGIGAFFGRPPVYPHVFNLYHAMYRVSSTYGETAWNARAYLEHSFLTARAMDKFGWRHYVRTVGTLGYARIYDLLDDLRAEGMEQEAAELLEQIRFKAEELVHLQYPYAGESVGDASGFEEVFNAAKFLADDEHLERTMRCAFAARSMSPCWWWYGSDKAWLETVSAGGVFAHADHGEACLSSTCIPNSLIFFQMLDRDYTIVPDSSMRMGFGGMMGPWALVGSDGGAASSYCPDRASRHYGYNPYTGLSGLGYFHYLREVGAYVLPNSTQETFTFGCHFESEGEQYRVTPWDGVGRKIVLRQIGAEFHLRFGQFQNLLLDHRKRWFEAEVRNPSDRHVASTLRLKGMWGAQMEIGGARIEAVDGEFRYPLDLPPREVVVVRGRVVGPVPGGAR